MRIACLLSLLLIAPLSAGQITTEPVQPQVRRALDTITNVKTEGRGNADAAKAAQTLSDAGLGALLPTLRAMAGASPLAQNWLRGVFESLADQAIKSGEPLPTDALDRFVMNTENDPQARRLAWEWLVKVEPELKAKRIFGMLLDPNPDFRRDAVALLIDEAEEQSEAEQSDAAKATYQQALEGAVHPDQVEDIVGKLDDLGVEVSLPAHFGFLTQWQLVGPFDNKDMGGFDVKYGPEKSATPDTSATYESTFGGEDAAVSWQEQSTDDDYGLLDIAKQIQNYKGSVMYATTTFDSPEAQEVQFRLGTPNAWKLWVNGKEVFQREEYHRSTKMDQYVVPAMLKAGENVILLKVLQNEQTQSWAQRYQFQLRITDATGTAVKEAE